MEVDFLGGFSEGSGAGDGGRVIGLMDPYELFYNVC